MEHNNGGLEHDFFLLISVWPGFHVSWPGCTLVFQNPPVIPSEEVFGAPKGLLGWCLGVLNTYSQSIWKTSVILIWILN